MSNKINEPLISKTLDRTSKEMVWELSDSEKKKSHTEESLESTMSSLPASEESTMHSLPMPKKNSIGSLPEPKEKNNGKKNSLTKQVSELRRELIEKKKIIGVLEKQKDELYQTLDLEHQRADEAEEKYTSLYDVNIDLRITIEKYEKLLGEIEDRDEYHQSKRKKVITRLEEDLSLAIELDEEELNKNRRICGCIKLKNSGPNIASLKNFHLRIKESACEPLYFSDDENVQPNQEINIWVKKYETANDDKNIDNMTIWDIVFPQEKAEVELINASNATICSAGYETSVKDAKYTFGIAENQVCR